MASDVLKKCQHCGKYRCVCQRPLFDEFGQGPRRSISWGPITLGAQVSIGFDVKIRLLPSPWTMPKVQFFEALGEIGGNGLTQYQQGAALSILVLTMDNEPEHDEGGWIESHRKA